jgi:RHS repeat-associated protein
VEHRSSYAAAVDHVIEYAYDYANRWVYKRLDDDGDGHAEQRRIFIYDGNQIVMDFWRTNSGDMQVGQLRERYLWGPAVDQILAEEAVDGGTPDLVQWTLTDHLNTVRDIAKYNPGSDMTTVVNHLIYDAFGRVTAESNPAVDSLFLFTGRPFDSHTQLQNNLNRWYDPRVGRWVSEDPIGFAAGDGNLYRYAANVPLQSVDPAGNTYSGRKIFVCVSLVASAGALWGFTSGICAFAFIPGEGAGGLDAAEVLACGAAITSAYATTVAGIDVCLDAGCHSAVAYLYQIKRDLEWLKASASSIAATIGVDLWSR